MKHFMIFSFALAFLVLQAPLDAQGRGPRDDRPRPGYNMIEKLDLSDAQKDKIEQLRLDHQKQMIDLRAALDKERLAMKELMGNDNLNRSAYLAEEEKLNAARDKMQKARANHQMDIYDQLNADQKKYGENTTANGVLKEIKISEEAAAVRVKEGLGLDRAGIIKLL